ncbi:MULTISPECIES: hypothetical protein [Paraburkholderia]|uniref:Uncharacterized protein n=1 Tax=Paraburkholderia madseniana TaxID=2599607 RepID=A0AAP5BN34_9BURK|nr:MULTISPECIES: hypothetical protein [Paraburkholderia]MCX4151005.1 hypothetical protein [Paraburkholderia madseniana]MCX4176645.1 hypothetical protein [Paraburkholderia madseniana]MDN7153937.1 hypothetical protein [Paraburkholderia sp. WS6]MDQ6412819.1 hypothetical protein [Paraburkholderia madseniana]MDQ6464636.1 hypothetical protein [Paraburkholderia madseniana]
MQDTFSLALEARTTWANFRVALVASEGVRTGVVKSLADTAGATARRLGFITYPDATMPNLIADVPELIQQWSDGYAEGADAQTHYAAFLTDWATDRSEAEEDAQQMRAEAGESGEEIDSPDGAHLADALPPIDAATFRAVHSRITKMASEANRRCGQSYEYMVSLLCGMVEGMLDEFAPEERPAVVLVARSFGYLSPDELAAAEKEMADAGYCSHGLDYWTCPCGCFEN